MPDKLTADERVQIRANIDEVAMLTNPLTCRALLSLMDQLEGLLAALPATADGVPIVPGMTVYCAIGPHLDEREVVGPYGKLALLTREPARYGACEGSAHRLANTVYAERPTLTVPSTELVSIIEP